MRHALRVHAVRTRRAAHDRVQHQSQLDRFLIDLVVVVGCRRLVVVLAQLLQVHVVVVGWHHEHGR